MLQPRREAAGGRVEAPGGRASAGDQPAQVSGGLVVGGRFGGLVKATPLAPWGRG